MKRMLSFVSLSFVLCVTARAQVVTAHLATSDFLGAATPHSAKQLGAGDASFVIGRHGTITASPTVGNNSLYIKVNAITFYKSDNCANGYAGRTSQDAMTYDLSSNSYWDSGRAIGGTGGNIGTFNLYYSAINEARTALATQSGETITLADTSASGYNCAAIHFLYRNGSDLNNSLVLNTYSDSSITSADGSDLNVAFSAVTDGTTVTAATLSSAPTLAAGAHLIVTDDSIPTPNLMPRATFIRNMDTTLHIKNDGYATTDGAITVANDSLFGQTANLFTNTCSSALGANASCDYVYDGLNHSPGATTVGDGAAIFTYTASGQSAQTLYFPFTIRPSASGSGDEGHGICWGQTIEGQTGVRADPDGENPVQLPSNVTFDDDVTGINQVRQILAGYFHSCALLSSGEVRCWGSNIFGNLGIGTTASEVTFKAQKVVATQAGGAALSGVEAISVGSTSSCALIDDGTVKCWGNKLFLGHGPLANDSGIPLTVKTDNTHNLSHVVAIASTGNGGHTCALTYQGAVYCWGFNESGQVGVGNDKTVIEYATMVTHLDHGAVALAMLDESSCAVLNDGSMECWGKNANAQLGAGSAGDFVANPMTVVGTASVEPALNDIIAGYGGGGHACALLANHTVKCWGSNNNGQIGNPDADTVDGNVVRPVSVDTSESSSDPLSNITMITAGEDYTCALISSGGMACWGESDTYQLGQGGTEPTNQRPAPVFVRNGDDTADLNNIIGIGAGYDTSCAIRTSALP